MLLDARNVPNGTTIEADVCVVGAGAAGITIARELIGHRVEVCLLESGGLEPDDVTNALSAGEVVGLPYYELDDTRARYFGGATNKWAGWCRPLDASDFESRAWVPHSGWPFDRKTIEPYYRLAQAVCQIPTFSYEAAEWVDVLPELYRVPLEGTGVATAVWQASPPTRFGDVYRQELDRAINVRVYLRGTAVELETDDTAQAVTRVRVARLGGSEFFIRARRYVLTLGAIESARLLLSSNRPEGLGNQHDNVGRYFLEHPHVTSGRVALAPRSSSRPPISALDRGVGGAVARLRLQRPAHDFKVAFTIAPETRDDLGILNYSAHLVPAGRTSRAEQEVYESLKLLVENARSLPRIASQIRHRSLPDGVGAHVARVVKHPVTAAAAVYQELLRRPEAMELYTQSEQSPNPDSRVTLVRERDELGMNRVRLDWQLSPLDKRTIRRAQSQVGAALEGAGIWSVTPDTWLVADDDSWPPHLRGGHHQMGTARMSADPKRGVVDADCRVHGVANLYVSDASVLPTAGFSNPLLTVVALAIRTAHHIRDVMVRSRP